MQAPGQFFDGNQGVSPMRMNQMAGMGMDHGMAGGGMHGMGGGMNSHQMGVMGMGGGGMQGMGGGMMVPPDVRRRVTRGMVEDGYPMH